MSQQQINLAEVTYLNLDSVAKIVKDFESPKPQENNPDAEARAEAKRRHNRSWLSFSNKAYSLISNTKAIDEVSYQAAEAA